MPRTPSRLAIVCATVLALVLAACGDDDGEQVSSAPPTSVAAADAVEDGGGNLDAEPVSTPALVAQGFPATCPSESETFVRMNDAAYQVFAVFDFVDESGQMRRLTNFIGTAWAVRDRVLATNGHVAGAFEESAAQGVQLSLAVAVQAGTGEIVRLLRGIVHPDYTAGFVLNTPDVALFTTQEVLPATLELAPPDSVVDLGDEIQIVGFPGDVDTFIPSAPGQTVPQATSLSGTISARRSHDPTVVVDIDTLDVYQHQAPTTPGTSGSAMAHCGLVAGVNNAGTVKQFFTPPAQEGQPPGVERQAAAANNFSVHVRHLHELLELFDDRALQGYELPLPAATPPPQSGGAGGAGGGGGDTASATLAGTYEGAIVSGELTNSFRFTIADDGSITGTSTWPATGEFTLTGQAAQDGSFQITDDAPERLGYRRGVYEGRIDAAGALAGVYYEQGQEQSSFPIGGQRAG